MVILRSCANTLALRNGWCLAGAGPTLAIAYAITHPDRVVGLVLRGIFLGREFEINCSIMAAPVCTIPRIEEFISIIPENERAIWSKRITSV